MEPTRLELLGPLVDFLLEAETPHVLATRTCRAATSTGAVGAAAIWRRLTVEGRDAWTQVAAHGPENALPEPALVEALLEDEATSSLLASTRVLRAGKDRALVLGEARLTDDSLDLCQSILALYVLLANDTQGEAADALRGPLPTTEEDPRSPAEFVRDLQNGAELIEIFGDELGSEERRDLEALLDTQFRLADEALRDFLGLGDDEEAA